MTHVRPNQILNLWFHLKGKALNYIFPDNFKDFTTKLLEVIKAKYLIKIQQTVHQKSVMKHPDCLR